MAHQTRIPPVKLTLDKILFNQLVGILDYNTNLKIEDENFSIIASKLKDKLLLYSVPRTKENGVEFVDIRFFTSEASDMIWQLLSQIEKKDILENYFDILISNRKEK